MTFDTLTANQQARVNLTRRIDRLQVSRMYAAPELAPQLTAQIGALWKRYEALVRDHNQRRRRTR